MALRYETITLPVPLGGLNTRDTPTLMNRLTSPNMQNIEIDRSFIKKRLGYSLFGQWLPLDGIGMELIQYTDGQGTVHHIALTTTHAYEYNSSLDTWDQITPSTILENADDVWVAGSGDTIASDTTIKVMGSASVKVTLVAERSDGDKLAFEDFSAINISAHTQIGFWLRSSTNLAANDLEIVVSESANGAKTGTFTESTNSSAMTADTWHFFSIDETLSTLNAVISVAIYANATIANGTILYIDDVRAYTEFTGLDSDRWSHTIASNLSEFQNNGGSALVISNGVDGPFFFEGQTSDIFQTLTVSSQLTNFQFANEIEDFWAHLFLFNYQAASPTKNFTRNVAFHDVSSAAYNTLDITETILTDSRGALRRAKKLGYDMVLYSNNTITICRRVGGTTLFIFPTVIYESGLFAEKGLWDSVNEHFFLGTDQKIYSFQGGTQLIPIGLQVEESLFAEIDPSKTAFVTAGLDPVKHKVYFFYPTTSDTYAKRYYAINFDRKPRTWEKGILADTVADFSIFDNLITWACNGPQVAGKTCDAVEFIAIACNNGAALGGFPQTTFLSRDGNVFRFTTGAANDNGVDIQAFFETPDLIPIEGRTDEEARWGGFNFSAKADIAGSTIDLSFSTDGGETFTAITTVSLTNQWKQYRNPVDVKTKKIRFKIFQDSSKDFKVRSLSYKVQLSTDR